MGDRRPLLRRRVRAYGTRRARAGTGYERFDIPIARDGGVADLLDESAHPGRRFDVVICESVSRVARRTFEGLSIERALERAEVPLFAANEPITLTGSRAQRILQRRINQYAACVDAVRVPAGFEPATPAGSDCKRST
jgi:hypothetical protein